MKRLFVYFAGLGDLVIFVPLFRKLAETGALDVLARPYGVPLLCDQSYIRKVYGLDHPNRGRKGFARILLGGHRRRLGINLALEGYDEVIVLDQERRVIVDWVRSWHGETGLRVALYPENDPARLSKAFASLGLDRVQADPFPRLDVSSAEKDAARRRLGDIGKRVVSVQVGSGPVNVRFRTRPNLKGLTYRQWAELITDIVDDGGADAFVFHGSDLESRDVTAVKNIVPDRYKCYVNDWTGKVGIAGLRAVLAGSYAMISIDTGPAHMAASVGCPMLVFFGPSSPEVYPMRGDGPVEILLGKAPCQFCTGTPGFKTCVDNICMKSLTRQMIFDAWKRLTAKI